MRKGNLFFILLLLLLCNVGISSNIAQDADANGDQWWNDRVFYEIFVRSFYDSDGDGIGDFQGIIQQLDYLNDGDPATTDDLGITGIWLMPINPSPSYHGYDVLDYRDVNSDYGTMDDFRQLLDEAHARGIAVIMDLVINHTGVDNEWFVASTDPESEFADWYVWADENPGFRGPDGQVVWHPLAGRYYYGVFWSGMPDLNYANPDVTAEMYDIATYWLNDVGVDGFRLDAIKHIVEDGRAQENSAQTLTWMADFNAFTESIVPNTLLVGEVWSRTEQVARYVDEQVDIAFEFDLAEAIIRGASFGLPSSILSQLETVLAAYPPGQYATFLTNHDQNRIMSQLRGDVGAAKNAANVLLTLPGVPFIYYGEEIGMLGTKPDEDIRVPMQWSAEANAGFSTGDELWRAVNPDYLEVNVAAQNEDPESLLNTYRTLIHTRNTSPALQQGDFLVVESEENNVLAFLRQHADQTVLVVLNLDDAPVNDYALSLVASSLNSAQPVLLLGTGDPANVELDTNGGFSAYLPLPELAAHSATIIQLRGE